jgi:hypothetical protein
MKIKIHHCISIGKSIRRKKWKKMEKNGGNLLHFKLSLVIARSSEFNASKIRITRSNFMMEAQSDKDFCNVV